MTKSNESAARLDRLVRAIRNDIIFGVYDPGARLKLAELQERYGATLSEARRALAELKSGQLVEHVVNSGYRVATPDETRRAQMRFVRTVLERSAAPFIVARATAKDLAALRELAERFDRSTGLQGRQEQAAANHDFHERLYATTGNAVLCEAIKDLRSRSHFGTTGRWRTVEGLKASSSDHFRMIEAIEDRDPVRLERVIVDHIEGF
jgi:DNA-binding GntR family transcriptional regulator